MKVAPGLFLLLLSCNAQPTIPVKNETTEQFMARIEAYPKPPKYLIDEIEHRLQHQPCIKALWNEERVYSYALPTREVDETIIEFKLRQAGQFGIVPGRRAVAPGATISNDDTPVNMAWGSFNRRTGMLRVDFCGASVPGDPSN